MQPINIKETDMKKFLCIVFVVVVVVSLVLSSGVAKAAEYQDTPKFSTPPTIMLHKEGPAFVQDLMIQLVSRGYRFITYHDLENYMKRGFIPQNVVILTIDDFGPYRVVDVHKQMIEVIRKYGGVAVLGLVRADFSDGDWTYLQSLVDAGWELANHSETHPEKGLPFLSDKDLQADIGYVNNQIRQHTTEEPISLVLPGGTYNSDTRINKDCEALGIKYIVGIAGGEEIFTDQTHYVGRVGVEGGAFRTVENMERRFLPQPQIVTHPTPSERQHRRGLQFM